MSLENDVRVLKQQVAVQTAALHWLTAFACRLAAKAADADKVRALLDAEQASDQGRHFSSLTTLSSISFITVSKFRAAPCRACRTAARWFSLRLISGRRGGLLVGWLDARLAGFAGCVEIMLGTPKQKVKRNS